MNYLCFNISEQYFVSFCNLHIMGQWLTIKFLFCAVCQPDEWQCDYGTCIDRRLRCNGRQDCPRDDSDERNCREYYKSMNSFSLTISNFNFSFLEEVLLIWQIFPKVNVIYNSCHSLNTVILNMWSVFLFLNETASWLHCILICMLLFQFWFYMHMVIYITLFELHVTAF